MTPEQFTATRDRYHALVEETFSRTLSLAESEEKERLGREIDAHFAPFYQPIIERLEAAIQECRSRREEDDAVQARMHQVLETHFRERGA